jgi:hypothetical protein
MRDVTAPHALDQQPGSLPDIKTDARGLTFVMRPSGTRSDERLVIQCDNDGEVWVSIRSDVAFNTSP